MQAASSPSTATVRSTTNLLLRCSSREGWHRVRALLGARRKNVRAEFVYPEFRRGACGAIRRGRAGHGGRTEYSRNGASALCSGGGGAGGVGVLGGGVGGG